MKKKPLPLEIGLPNGKTLYVKSLPEDELSLVKALIKKEQISVSTPVENIGLMMYDDGYENPFIAKFSDEEEKKWYPSISNPKQELYFMRGRNYPPPKLVRKKNPLIKVVKRGPRRLVKLS